MPEQQRYSFLAVMPDQPEPQEPLSAHPYNLARLTDDEWEELTFLLAHREDRRVARLRAPDGGLDTLLPSGDRAGKGERGWQAKHYPGDIHWSECEKSLDRAVSVWKVRHVTFTFPRDLTKKDHETFHEKLSGRHDGVTVDYWSAGKINAELLADEHGARIARRFFGPKDPIAEIERAMRAGGELSRGEHVLDRELAIDEFVQAVDPHFHWVIYKLQAGDPAPPRTDGAAMRLEFAKGDARLLADAIPRNPTSLEHYGPLATFVTDDSPEGREAQRLLNELLTSGGRVELKDGIRVAMERVPQPFSELMAEPVAGEIVIKSVRDASPWYLTIEASSSLGDAQIDLDLHPVEPGREWVSEWRGSRGGLEMQVQTRWSVNRGRGETNLRLHVTASDAPLADRFQALSVMVALHGEGTFRLVDRAGNREPLERPTHRRTPQPEIVEGARLIGALVEIEKASGQTVPPIPDEVPLRDVDALVAAGDRLRAGGELWRLREGKFRATHTGAQGISQGGPNIEIRDTAVVRVFGVEIPVATRVINLPHMVTQEVRRIPGEEDLWEVVLVPLEAQEAEVWVEYRPLADGGSDR